jgi:hypothetical protein
MQKKFNTNFRIMKKFDYEYLNIGIIEFFLLTLLSAHNSHSTLLFFFEL